MQRADPTPTPPERSIRALPLVLLALGMTLPLGVAALLPWQFPLPTYLAIHTVMEVFAVIVAAIAFAVGWNTAGPSRTPGLAVLAAGFMAVALFDMLHLLSYQGMPDFVTPSGPAKAIFFWLAARTTAAVSLLWFAGAPNRLEPRRLVLAVTIGWVGLTSWVVLAHQDALPVVFVPGSGLTPTKVAVEVALIGMYVAVVPVLARRAPLRSSVRRDHLAAAAVAMAVSEAPFFLYTHVTDSFNFVGHVEKILAYALLYVAVFRDTVKEPYLRLEATIDALRNSEERFRELAGAVEEVFFLTDAATGEVLYVSPAIERILLRPASPGDGGPNGLFQYLHPDDRERMLELKRARQEREVTGEVRILRPGGEERWLYLRMGPVRDANGRVYRIAGVVRDITEEKRLHARLASAQRMETVSRLAAGIAHDFNNLLTVILTSTNFATESARGRDASLEQDIASIANAARRAQGLTRQLLSVARTEPGTAKVIDLGEVVGGIHGMVERLVGGEVRVQAGLAPQGHHVLADPAQIERVLVGWAIDARDGSRPGGPPAVELRPAEASDLERHETAGSAEAWVVLRTSDAGVGAPVDLLLPRAEPPSAPAPSQVPVAPGDGALVMVVDDEPQVRRSTARALQAHGYATIEAADGREALALLPDHPSIALLLTDLTMPGMNGVTLAAEAQKMRADLPVLFMSGFADGDLPTPLLAKPFTTAELVDAASQAMGAR